MEEPPFNSLFKFYFFIAVLGAFIAVQAFL